MQPTDSCKCPVDLDVINPGDIVTLKTGRRGKVRELGGMDGEFTLLSGKGKRRL